MFPLDCEGIGEHCSESCHTEFGRIRAVGFIDPCYDLDINSQESWDEGVAGGFITIVPQTNGELTIDQLQGDGYGKRPQTNTIKEYTLTYNDPTFIGNYNFYDGASGQYKYKIFFRTSDAIYFSDTAVLITPNFSIQNDLGQRIDWTVTLTWRSKFFPVINTALNSEYLFACTACTPQICFFIQSVTGNLVDNTDPCNPVVDAAVSADLGNVLTLGSDGLPFFDGSGIPCCDLQEVTDAGNSTTNDIIFGPGAGLLFDNGARVREGTTDAGLGGLAGVALRCSIDYELKWDAGSLYVMEQNGFTIRKVVYKFSFTPTATDDATKGFIVGSLWILDDETTYECTDNTSGAAVWVLRVPGTVTSVDLTMPSAFNVSGNPITTSGTLAVTGAGLVSQYIRGDGTLANFPATGGGGSSVSYYLNGGTNQGTFGGNTYYEMSKTAVVGTGVPFSINADGYIAQFLTDAGDPALLNIPAGNWNFEMYFNASSPGGTPNFYVELYKYDGTTFTLIASSSAAPEGITNGTAVDAYFTPIAVPQTTLAVTDRLAIRIWVNHSGRTITLHTQDNTLCQIITTFTTGLTALNGLTDQVQNFATGTSGTDFGISSSGSTHTFNLPTASAVNRGALSSSDWSTFDAKQDNIIRIRKAGGNQTTTAATAQNITELVTADLEANKVYFVSGTIRIGCNNTGGVLFGITVPTGATAVLSTSSIGTSGTNFQHVTADHTGLSSVAIGRVNNIFQIAFYGRVSMGATTGNVQITFASAVAGQTSTIYGGSQSMLTFIKIN